MGCIVNGPGEMADADFGYVGSGPGKITLYKGKEVMKRGVNSETAVYELIQLLKEHNVWVEPDFHNVECESVRCRMRMKCGIEWKNEFYNLQIQFYISSFHYSFLTIHHITTLSSY